MTLIDDARNKAKHWAAFDKPVLARTIEIQADEIDRLRAVLREIAAVSALCDVLVPRAWARRALACDDEQDQDNK